MEILQVYSKACNYYTISGSSLLLSQAQKHCLLPNLKELSFVDETQSACGQDEAMWIMAFGSDTVRSVLLPRHRGRNEWKFTYSTASTILDTLVQRCPNITKLSIYPQQDSSDSSATASLDIYSTSSDGSTPSNTSTSAGISELPKWWYEYLRELPQLSYLSVTDGWLFRPCLIALSQLPNLHTLEFHSETIFEVQESEVTDSDLSNEAFSRLRQLSLHGLDQDDVVDVLGIQKLLRNITKFEFEHEMALNSFEERDDWITYEFLPLLVNLPCLKDLRIKETFSPHMVEEDEIYMIAVPEILDVMAKLPLETVYLGSIHLGTTLLELELVSIWPNVTELSMPSQHASLAELSYFAAMPKLRRLTLKLDLTKVETPTNIPLSNHASLRTLKSGEWGTIADTFYVMEHNAR